MTVKNGSWDDLWKINKYFYIGISFFSFFLRIKMDICWNEILGDIRKVTFERGIFERVKMKMKMQIILSLKGIAMFYLTRG